MFMPQTTPITKKRRGPTCCSDPPPARRGGDHVPPLIRRVQMGGISLVDVRTALPFPGPARGGVAGAQRKRGAVRIDQLPAVRRVFPGEEESYGNIDEIRIAVISFPVRVRELA